MSFKGCNVGILVQRYSDCWYFGATIVGILVQRCWYFGATMLVFWCNDSPESPLVIAVQPPLQSIQLKNKRLINLLIS